MDKVLEVVVVATIVIVIGAIMTYIVNDEASSFDEFIGGQTDDAQCELWLSQGKCENHASCDWDQSDCIDEGGSCPDGQYYCSDQETCISDSAPCY